VSVELKSEDCLEFQSAYIQTTLDKVARWQLAHPTPSERDWEHGAFLAGLYAAYETTGAQDVYDALIAWGNRNSWQPANRWYHADDIAICQTYIDLFRIEKREEMLKPSLDTLHKLITTPYPDSRSICWWWCDALFMGPPSLVKLGLTLGKDEYLQKSDELFKECYDLLYNKEEHLFARDQRYVIKNDSNDRYEANGKKIFWSRGNGWVMGGLVRLLKELPADYSKRNFYASLLKEMAARIIELQQADGLWRASLLDPEAYPGGEVSGTGFYCYALAYGVNCGLLDKKTYLPAIQKAWIGLNNCLNNEGRLGWCQPVGDSPGKNINKDSWTVFGTGAFLLAGSEVIKLNGGRQDIWNKHFYMMNKGDSRELPAIAGVTYSSANEAIIAVAGNKITAKSDGDCIVYSKDDKGEREFAHITVGWQQQNPVLPYSWKMYVPDGEAHNFNGNIYIYGSLDYSKVFCSPYYISLMTRDMKRWDSFGQSFSSFDKDVEQPFPGRILWDSDGHYHDGKYYLYGFYEWQQGKENWTFVLESDSPMGPFRNLRWVVGDKSGKPVDGISTEVFTDNDGQRYTTYAPTMNAVEDNHAVIARLKDADIIDESSVTDMKPYLKDFYEASSLRRRGDTYYLVYAENCDKITDRNHTPKRLSYATGKNILGPYTYRGVIITVEDLPGNGNIQGSIEHFGDDWYVFYHRALNGVWNKRSLCIERITFDKDGLIVPVVPTSSGVAVNGLETAKPIYFNTTVFGKNYRFEDRGEAGFITVQSNAEIGFRYINFTGKERTLTLKGENLDKIEYIKVFANGRLIGGQRNNNTIQLSNVRKGKAELTIAVYTTDNVALESMTFNK
jgi:rhamnogalacturonyl hydrolase YesR